MHTALVFSSCTASKDDSVYLEPGAPTTGPSDYVGDVELRNMLLKTRGQVLSDPRARRGTRQTYALDLYVRTGQMYADLYKNSYATLKEALVKGDMQWFFLSGGYGVLHALEPATKYQATFSYGIAQQRNIPYTAKIWGRTLVDICEHIMKRYPTSSVYVFGSQDYTVFLKSTRRWATMEYIKVIESTGTVGPRRLAPIVEELARSFLSGQASTFDKKYPGSFIKLPQ